MLLPLLLAQVWVPRGSLWDPTTEKGKLWAGRCGQARGEVLPGGTHAKLVEICAERSSRW